MLSEDSDYVCTLDAASIKKAKDELNEIPEDRLAAVQAFRDWIKEQPHIRWPRTDTLTMLLFLRGCKYSQVKAREKLEETLRLHVTFPKYTTKVDGHDPVYMKIADSGYLIPLKKRSPQGCLIVVQRFEILQNLILKEKIGIECFHKFFQLFMHSYLTKSEMTQVNGLMFVADFYGMTASGLAKLMSKDSGKIQKAYQKASPGRFKGFNYYRTGVLFETMMNFYKPFLSQKWIDRIKIHATMESIYKVIPKEYLPVEFLPDDYSGPNAGTMDENLQDFKDTIFQEDVIKEVAFKTSDAFWIDDTKKPEQEVTQHFRKLNID